MKSPPSVQEYLNAFTRDPDKAPIILWHWTRAAPDEAMEQQWAAAHIVEAPIIIARQRGVPVTDEYAKDPLVWRVVEVDWNDPEAAAATIAPVLDEVQRIHNPQRRFIHAWDCGCTITLEANPIKPRDGTGMVLRACDAGPACPNAREGANLLARAAREHGKPFHVQHQERHPAG